MTEKSSNKYLSEKRSEIRENLEQLHSVELKFQGLPIYLFKVKDISKNGICFLIKENSDILEHLKTGQILNLSYRYEENTQIPESLVSEIKHITKSEKGKYAGHYLVGVLILDKQNNVLS
jgi:hypothetical protein